MKAMTYVDGGYVVQSTYRGGAGMRRPKTEAVGRPYQRPAQGTGMTLHDILFPSLSNDGRRV
ncbi:hypothetical protein [Pandoraea apista]|uniref:hypothetical protein n=1 Tax=Pandoraea apista TaxID=93218 RepID=UPI000F99B63C|nr:hypothetical protein [Pandoraea apista]RRJ73625.1 hypothetical protein EIL82_19495 [Pandoraea apista]